MKQCIVVNATALDQSGALSILRQFVANIPVDNRNWLLFVSPTINISTDNPNVRIEPIKGVKPMHKRLIWDALGLKKWLKKNKIEPLASVSLQNTGFNVGKKVPNYIYYHQSIPFYPFKWNPLKKQERTFWFYKNVYPFFVNIFLKKDTQIFVQLEFIKEGFAKRFKHSTELIRVYSPSVIVPKTTERDDTAASEAIRLLYPAMPHFYKNHRIISEALKLTDANVEVLFTIPREIQGIKDSRIKMIGMQPYERICELYRSCDALLFPSYIETFGLPLLEAAMTGMPIIAADLPYAREVLVSYKGVTYVPYNDPTEWALAIANVEKKKRHKPLKINNRPGWQELLKAIK